MSSYNHEKYVAQAIESVLNQTFRDLELIIVDDCSTDNSRKIIETYQARDERVRAFFHEKNMGIPKTANDCLKRVKGKFISFIGSDDMWVHSKLEKQLKALRNNEDKLLWSEAFIIDGKGLPTGGTITQLLYSRKKSGDLFEELLQESFVFFQSLIFKAKYVEGLQRDEELKYVSDHRFIVDLSKNHEFIFMKEPLAKYRIHRDNITNKHKLGWMKERIILRKYFLQKYSDLISTRTKADIHYKIGHAYSLLGDQLTAQYYYLRAFYIDHFHVSGALYLILALTEGKGRIGKPIVKYYFNFTSFFANLKSR